MRGREQRHDARIRTAAEVGADRHIAPELQPDRVLEQPAHLDDEILLGVVRVDAEPRLPETFRPLVAGGQIDHLPVPGAQLADAREHRVLARDELERHVLADRVLIRHRRDRRMLEQRLDLRREQDVAVRRVVVQGLDAEVVPGDEHRLPVRGRTS